MKLIEKYIIKQLAISSFLLVTLIISIFGLSKSVQLIELSINRGLPFVYFLKLIFFSLPSIIPIILPIVISLAILFTYSRMRNDSELIIMESAGISLRQLIRPVILFGMFLSIVSFTFTVLISSSSNKNFKLLLYTIKNKYSTSLLEEGTFNTIGKNYTIFIKKRDNTGKLENVFIHDSSDKSKPTTLIAEKGSLIESNSFTKILLENGTQHFFSNENKKLSVLYFEKYLMNISDNNDSSFKRNWKSPSERNLYELLNPDLTNGDDKNNLQAFRAEFIQRFALPINVLTFSFLVVSFMVSQKFNRVESFNTNLKIMLLIIVQKSVFILCSNIAIKNINFEFFNLIPSVISILFGFYILNRKKTI